MGAGTKVVMGLRVLALIAALAVVGLGAWCKCACSCAICNILTVLDSQVNHTRCRDPWRRSIGQVGTRRTRSITVEGFLRCCHRWHHDDVDLDGCCKHLQPYAMNVANNEGLHFVPHLATSHLLRMCPSTCDAIFRSRSPRATFHNRDDHSIRLHTQFRIEHDRIHQDGPQHCRLRGPHHVHHDTASEQGPRRNYRDRELHPYRNHHHCNGPSVYASISQGELLFRTNGISPRHGPRISSACATDAVGKPSTNNLRPTETASQTIGRYASDGRRNGSSSRSCTAQTRRFGNKSIKQLLRR